MNRLRASAIAAISLAIAVAACERSSLPTAPTSQASPSASAPSAQPSQPRVGMTHPDFRVYDRQNGLYIVGAVAIATWVETDDGEIYTCTATSTSPLGKVMFLMPEDVTVITIDITAEGYCPYHEENRLFGGKGGWTYLYMRSEEFGCPA